jgi:5-(carboxyamino)imidazole ribonucleotide mutase
VVALVAGGAIAALGVAVVGSFLGLPTVALWVVAVAVLAAIAYPLFRTDDAPVEDASVPSQERDSAHERQAPVPRTGGTDMSDAPLVAIVMGSESDRAVMQEAEKTLADLGVPFETVVASAHRQPAKVHEWASGLADRGVKVVIAGAGKAAHLGGAVAAYTPLPVIAVPMKTSDLGGLDSLLSMVQMPSGVPVACVAINGARNAAILATQILGTSLPQYRAAVEAMKRDMAAG